MIDLSEIKYSSNGPVYSNYLGVKIITKKKETPAKKNQTSAKKILIMLTVILSVVVIVLGIQVVLTPYQSIKIVSVILAVLVSVAVGVLLREMLIYIKGV